MAMGIMPAIMGIMGIAGIIVGNMPGIGIIIPGIMPAIGIIMLGNIPGIGIMPGITGDDSSSAAFSSGFSGTTSIWGVSVRFSVKRQSCHRIKSISTEESIASAFHMWSCD